MLILIGIFIIGIELLLISCIYSPLQFQSTTHIFVKVVKLFAIIKGTGVRMVTNGTSVPNLVVSNISEEKAYCMYKKHTN